MEGMYGMSAKAEAPEQDRVSELTEQLNMLKHQEPVRLLVELLKIKREKYRDRLERGEDDLSRGKALECKALLQILG